MNFNAVITLFSVLALAAFGCSSESNSSSAGDAATPLADTGGGGAIADAGESGDSALQSDGAVAADAGQAPDAANGPDAGRMFPEPTFGLTEATLEHDGENRRYLVYVPESYSADTPAPVLFNFHGNGGTAERHINIANMRPLADSDGVILVYPQGTILEGEPHWNPLLDSELNKSDADDLGFVAAMIDALAEQLNIDDQRVYATGYSNGAGMVYGLACYLSDRIAAVAPVSGSMYIESRGNCNATHPTSIAVFNGTQDFIRPYGGYEGFLLPVEEAVAFWRNHNNISAMPTTDSFSTNGLTVERSVYTGGDGGASVALYKMVGGDHVWFDIDIEGADLNQTIWNFLSASDLSGGR